MIPKTSRVRIRRAQRAAELLALRLKGYNFRQIGELMGFSEQRAFFIVREELARLNRERSAAASEVLRRELDRLDRLLWDHWLDAQKHDMQALRRVVVILSLKARLLLPDEAEKLKPPPPPNSWAWLRNIMIDDGEPGFGPAGKSG